MNLAYNSKMCSQRATKVNMLRIGYWLKTLPQMPGRIIPVLLHLFAFMWLWNIRDAFSLQCNDAFLYTLCQHGIGASIILLFMLFLLLLLLVFSCPRHAKQFESRLIQIDVANHYRMPPSLIARLPIKNTKAYRLVFYSLGISMNEWIARRDDIEDALNLHYVESPQYGGRNGNNRNIIVLTVAPGVNKTNQEVLYDDSL